MVKYLNQELTHLNLFFGLKSKPAVAATTSVGRWVGLLVKILIDFDLQNPTRKGSGRLLQGQWKNAESSREIRMMRRECPVGNWRKFLAKNIWHTICLYTEIIGTVASIRPSSVTRRVLSGIVKQFIYPILTPMLFNDDLLSLSPTIILTCVYFMT